MIIEEVEAQTYIDRLAWRYATKKFDPTKKIPAETWSALEKSLQLSPSSFGLQPYAFIVVTNREVKAKLRADAHDQSRWAFSWRRQQTSGSTLVQWKVFCLRCLTKFCSSTGNNFAQW
jgi:nitroreductase